MTTVDIFLLTLGGIVLLSSNFAYAGSTIDFWDEVFDFKFHRFFKILFIVPPIGIIMASFIFIMVIFVLFVLIPIDEISKKFKIKILRKRNIGDNNPIPPADSGEEENNIVQTDILINELPKDPPFDWLKWINEMNKDEKSKQLKKKFIKGLSS